VVSEHSTGAGGRAPGLQAGQGRIELQARDAPDVAGRRFAGMNVLQGFGVLARVGEQQLVLDAKLLEQLPTTRALRCKVDKVTHGDTDGSR
jgi:hypothetical protein